MKKFLAILLVFAITLSFSGVTAFAAVTKARRVAVTKTKGTVSVGKTIYLDVSVYPNDVDYDKVSWSTSDYDIIDLDEYGEVTGLEPGTATVKATVYALDRDRFTDAAQQIQNKNYNKYIRIGSGETTIKVTGKSPSAGTGILPRDVDDDGNVVKLTDSNGAITSTTVTNAVKKAVVKNSTTSTAFKNYESVSAFALQSAASAMKGGTVILHFDTMKDNAIDGRLTINPNNADDLKNDINVGVSTGDLKTYKARGVFQKYFKNEFVVIRAEQSGSYGMNVKISAQIGDKLSKAKSLKLYVYDPTTGKYNEIKDSGISIDSKGFVQFTTSTGGYLIVSNGALAKK